MTWGTKTTLAIHCRDKKHKPDFEKTQILAFERQKQKRELLEPTFINFNGHTVNYKVDTNRNIPYSEF
jgi:hypothetical protein